MFWGWENTEGQWGSKTRIGKNWLKDIRTVVHSNHKNLNVKVEASFGHAFLFVSLTVYAKKLIFLFLICLVFSYCFYPYVSFVEIKSMFWAWALCHSKGHSKSMQLSLSVQAVWLSLYSFSDKFACDPFTGWEFVSLCIMLLLFSLHFCLTLFSS